MKQVLYTIAVFTSLVQTSQSSPLCLIKDCGAIVKTKQGASLNDTIHNSQAIKYCLELANNRSFEEFGPQAKTVLLPKGKVISQMGFQVNNLVDVTLQIDGIIEASTYYDQWPLGQPDNNEVIDLLSFGNCQNLKIQGEGTVDGLGYGWWQREWNIQNKYGRPNLLDFSQVRNSEISGVRFINSPYYHMSLSDIDSINIHDLEIFVNILKQKESYTDEKEYYSFQDQVEEFAYNLFIHFLGEYSSIAKYLIGPKTELSWPIFPLNTDGIDPSGSNVTIRNVNITNFDDAVAVKPCNKGCQVAKNGCSEDILVQNVNVMFGVGMTIGSVPPNGNHACVRNVSFIDINFEYPLKALYVKTNPGDGGDGEIVNLLYENIKIHFPVWWSIYIGPQQQEQPDGGGPGCMLYPLGGCRTQPRIDIRNITIRNLNSTGGFLSPGVIRCNESNPCTGINFENVNIEGWWEKMEWSFISEYSYGNVINTHPDPQLGKPSERVFELFTVQNFFIFLQEFMNFYKLEKTNIEGWEVLIGIAVWAIDYVINGGHI